MSAIIASNFVSAFFFANLTKYTQIQEGQVNVGDELLRRTVVVVTSYCHTKNLEDKIKKNQEDQ